MTILRNLWHGLWPWCGNCKNIVPCTSCNGDVHELCVCARDGATIAQFLGWRKDLVQFPHKTDACKRGGVR